MPTQPKSESGGHDVFEELCALAAVGELSAEELTELRRHLGECAACREMHADFTRLASDDIAQAALGQGTGSAFGKAEAGMLDEQALLSKVLARSERERACASLPAADGLVESMLPRALARALHGSSQVRGRKLAYAAAACLLCAAAALGGYHLREREFSWLLAVRNAEINGWKSQAEAAAKQNRSLSESLDQAQAKERASEKSEARAYTRSADLKSQLEATVGRERALADEFSARQVELGRLARDLSAAHADAEEKDKAIAQLESRLQSAVGRMAQQDQIADDLRSRLQHAEASSATPPSPDVGDEEAKELLSARDLHIVDVYDVDANGHTRRTYGRVYYVEKKLLVFYAFDLQDKPRKRMPVSFQAWGYQQAGDRRPESLGLFHLDDASLSRWVLKVRSPGVLARIDAVFVSLEPPGGSPVPNGRRVLYANLAGPPNHP